MIDGIEVKMTVLPSPDNEYMFVNYYVYNRENTEKKVKLGSCADIQMDGHGVGADDPADTAALYRTDKGFYMQNTDNHSSFNLYTGESITGLKGPDTYWRGYFNDRKSYVFDNDDLVNQACVGMDSGLAYSWNITLHPHEMVHRRVAFSCRVNAYYVSYDWGDDDNNGTLLHPFLTLEHAIEKIGDRKGYIFIIDYEMIDAPIELSGQNCDITIQSSDYKVDEDNYDDDATISPAKIEKEGDEDIRSLERDKDYNGPLFKVTGGKLTFRQIDINGEKKESAGPLIEATGGTLTLGTAARVINAKGTATDQGSAIDLRGSANFVMNGGRITGNESAEGGKGAVYYHSSGAFRVSNEVNIQDNKDRAGTPANATLAAGKTIAVEGDLKKGKIGITSETLPEVMPGSVPTAANQEIPVAKIGDSYQNPPITFPFADNFEADQKEKQGVGVYVGTKFTGSTDNRKYAVLRRNGYRINFVYADIRGGAVRGTKNRTQQFGAGEPVEENAPAPVTGYMLKEVKIEQGGRSALKAETSGTDMGKITGTMPAENVTVTYLYEKVKGSIRFVANGGTPKPADIEGTIGSPVNGVFPGKNIAKRGYKFEGWIQGIYQPGSKTWRYPSQPYTYVSGLPTEFLPDPVAYYAMFTPDHSVKFDWTTAYQNQNGSIEFQTKITEKAYSVENPVAANQKPIKGYKWSPEDSRQMPSVFPFYREGNQEPTPFGSFDGNGHFSGIMPGQNASVIYRYKVDYSDPNGRSPLTVRYVTGSGGSEREVSTAFQQELYPEDSISVSPVNVFGYDLDPEHCRITAGDQADDRDGHLVSQVTGDFDSAGNYTGKMPNQPVEITYTYKPNGEGYRFQVRYEDMESEDSLLKEISSVTEKHPADANVKATYALPYGYRYAEQKAEPQAPEAQFDGAHNYTARMPVDDLTVTYRHQRDSSQWATIHYNGGRYGALSHDNERPSDDPNKKVSPDVIKDHDGSYLTEVLKADNQGHGDTWADVKKKRLVPLVSLDSTNSESQYYRFAGWFIDADGDGVWDKNDDREKLISEDQTFAGATTLTAAFEEDPDKWVDVQLTAGDHGTLTENGTGNPISHPVTIHTRCDSKWGDLLLPNNKPEVNYLVRGWYDGARKMGENDSLRNGATYTLQFYPDPLVFGTNAGDVDAAGSLDEDLSLIHI